MAGPRGALALACAFALVANAEAKARAGRRGGGYSIVNTGQGGDSHRGDVLGYSSESHLRRVSSRERDSQKTSGFLCDGTWGESASLR